MQQHQTRACNKLRLCNTYKCHNNQLLSRLIFQIFLKATLTLGNSWDNKKLKIVSLVTNKKQCRHSIWEKLRIQHSEKNVTKKDTLNSFPLIRTQMGTLSSASGKSFAKLNLPTSVAVLVSRWTPSPKKKWKRASRWTVSQWKDTWCTMTSQRKPTTMPDLCRPNKLGRFECLVLNRTEAYENRRSALRITNYDHLSKRWQ